MTDEYESLRNHVADQFRVIFPEYEICVEQDDETWNVWVSVPGIDVQFDIGTGRHVVYHFDFEIGSDDSEFYFTEVEGRHPDVIVKIPE